MIKEVIMYSGSCDCCGEIMEHYQEGWTCLNDESLVRDCMDDQGWHFKDADGNITTELHFCPNCATINDDDELVIDWSRKKENSLNK